LSLIALRLRHLAPLRLKVYYSSPGAGGGSNSRLNADYAVIRNGDSPTPSLGGPWPDAAVNRYAFGTSGCELARMVPVRDCLPRARSKRDDTVTGRVALGRNETDAGNQLNLPLDNVDKVSVREQRQNSMWRVRNRGT
jgi:hypothetical protein